MPRTCAVSRGHAAARSSTAWIAASTQASGSCSDQSGAGCDRASSREAVATIAPASFASTAFTPDVPMSIPRYTNIPPFRLPRGRANCVAFPAKCRLFELGLPLRTALWWRVLRQIVPHHDVDPDILLFTQDRLTSGEREQHAYGGPRLMPGVLRDGRIDHTLQKQLARHDSH